METYLFLLRIIEKTNDLIREATIVHNLLAESMWEYKIYYKSNILNTYNDSDNDMIEQILKFI